MCMFPCIFYINITAKGNTSLKSLRSVQISILEPKNYTRRSKISSGL